MCHFVKKVIVFYVFVLTGRRDLSGTHRGKNVLVDVGRSRLEEVEGLLQQGASSNLKDEVS